MIYRIERSFPLTTSATPFSNHSLICPSPSPNSVPQVCPHSAVPPALQARAKAAANSLAPKHLPPGRARGAGARAACQPRRRRAASRAPARRRRAWPRAPTPPAARPRPRARRSPPRLPCA